MKTTTTLTLLSSFLSLTAAQVTFNPNGTFTCTSTGAVAYCAGDSLSTNIIIRCADGVGQPGNCNDNLAGVPPVGVKDFAPCYQTSPTAGDAACSYNGIVYPDSGGSFPIPSNSTSSSATTTTLSVASASGTGVPTTTTGNNATITISTGTPTPTTTEFAGAAVGRAHLGWGILLGLGMTMAIGI